MNWENFAASKIVSILGWTLLHSVWQIAFAAAVLFLILRFSAGLSANARYLFALAALTAAFCLPLATFISFFAESPIAAHISAVESEKARRAVDKPAPGNVVGVPGDGRQSTVSANENEFLSFEMFSTNFQSCVSKSLPTLVLLWIVGIGFYALRLGGGALQLRRYKTRGIGDPSPEWNERFAALREKLKIAQTVRLLESNRIATPIVVGCLKPLILVPASIFAQMNPRELETILMHELIHIRRRDNLINFWQSFVEILFFYHPYARWISAVIRREREFACDAAVLETAGGRRVVYADALANLEAIRLTTNENTTPLSMAATGGKLMKRIERILNADAAHPANSKRPLLPAILAALFVTAIMTGVFSAPRAFYASAQGGAKDKKMAVGFVSIPPLDRSTNAPQDADATARILIEKLKARKIPAIGFVQGNMISDGDKMFPVRANIVRLWRDAGFEIGVGGYKHIWFYDTPYEEYVVNVEKNERVTRAILAERNLPLRYFSYPFLNTGKTVEDKKRFEDWLKTRNLRSVKYTFDNQEWMYSFAYDAARKDNDLNRMREVRTEFLDYMTKMLAHYEAYSNEMFGRDIAQTLVLTASRLVADSSDELFGMFEKNGYKFVSIDEAQADAAYRTPENFAGVKAGVSWFERWQLAQNKKLRDEPAVNSQIEKTWREKGNGK